MVEDNKTYVLICYVPLDYCEQVKAALFAAGAGKLGAYDSCCWQTEGVGQFRPLSGSNPHIGKPGEIEKVPEIKLELICTQVLIADLIAAIRSSHPYETPAFHFIALFAPDHT